MKKVTSVAVLVLKAHSNESVGSIRQKIARKMKLPVEQVQFVPNEKVVRFLCILNL